MTCPKCNTFNEPDADFCTVCGQSLAISVRGAAPPVNYGYGQPAPSTTPSSAPGAEIEALNYSRYVDLLCQGQSFLAQIAIRFYYVTGLKSYLVTHHDHFVVPNLNRDAAETIKLVKREMDGLAYEELLTTFLYMKTEHIQTLPYLSKSMVRPQLDVAGGVAGLINLILEVLFGVFYLIADLIKTVVRAIAQGSGMAVRSVGRDGKDELLSDKRLMLASTYRHTRTYTYVRDVGPETYIGWFTHHEPPPSLGMLFGLTLIYLLVGLLTGIGAGIPFLALIGVAGGIFYLLWVAPWALSRLGALPQPRYISGLVQALWIPLTLLAPGGGRGFGFGLQELLLLPFSMFVMPFVGGFRAAGSSDPILSILVMSGVTAITLLVWIVLLVFLRAAGLRANYFDVFDAETHSSIVKQRIGMILGEALADAGYSQDQIADILSQKSPGAGRYRRARI